MEDFKKKTRILVVVLNSKVLQCRREILNQQIFCLFNIQVSPSCMMEEKRTNLASTLSFIALLSLQHFCLIQIKILLLKQNNVLF